MDKLRYLNLGFIPNNHMIALEQWTTYWAEKQPTFIAMRFASPSLFIVGDKPAREHIHLENLDRPITRFGSTGFHTPGILGEQDG